MIDAFLGTLALVLSTIIAPFVLYLLAIILVNAFGRKEELATSDDVQFVILIPAHNESANIVETVRSLQEINYPKERYNIIVIADNCDDNTADLARQTGVTAWEREDARKRGKGYALEMAVDRLMNEMPSVDAVMIVDADTHVHPNILKRSAHLINNGEDWIQVYYTVSNANASWRTKLFCLSFALINCIILRGQDLLGLGCSLRGNGMIYTTKGLKRVPLKAYGLAEDMEFGWQLRLASERVRFIHDVFVSGEMVSESGVAADSQRLRWEHGRRNVRQQFFYQVLASQFSIWKKLVLLVDLVMPPLSRLVALILASIAVSAFYTNWLLYLNLGFLIIVVLYVLSPTLFIKLPISFYLAIFSVPKFFAWKIRLLFKKKPSAWIRTERENERTKRLPLLPHKE